MYKRQPPKPASIELGGKRCRASDATVVNEGVVFARECECGRVLVCVCPTGLSSPPPPPTCWQNRVSLPSADASPHQPAWRADQEPGSTLHSVKTRPVLLLLLPGKKPPPAFAAPTAAAAARLSGATGKPDDRQTRADELLQHQKSIRPISFRSANKTCLHFQVQPQIPISFADHETIAYSSFEGAFSTFLLYLSSRNRAERNIGQVG